MSNVLGDIKQQQVLTLGRLGWTLSRIQQTTGVRRETISGYLKIDQQGMHNALKAFEKARGEHTQADTQSAGAETTSGMNDAQKLLQ